MPAPLASHAEMSRLPLPDLRAAIRAGRWTRHTAGLAKGRLQCNLAIVATDMADDFLEFCRLNPKPCPVVGVGAPGVPHIPALGKGIDIRSDVPAYRVWRDGALVEERTDIADLWRDDLVTVALGCSFTFETALIEAGIPVRHIEADRTVPMFRSSIALDGVGCFQGGMVVTMRPIAEDRVDDAIRISGAYPQAHGAPVAVGDPGAIGIVDLSRPDYGDPIDIRPGDVPVFWACGVTPQNVLLEARLPFCITHKPGCMLIADIGEREDARIPGHRAPDTTHKTGSFHHA